jgi:hypothetical protein
MVGGIMKANDGGVRARVAHDDAADCRIALMVAVRAART